MADNAIETFGLSKDFGRTGTVGPIAAVRDLNLTIGRGEMFSLVGPDGAGKSTTLRMLCGVIKPSRGTATILGRDLLAESGAIKTRVGYFSQQFTLYGDLSVDENIEFFAEIHEVRNYRVRREELLQFTRLTPFRKRLADHLSGGMKQKLALACTLVHMPDIIFLDEPTTGVDPLSRRDFWIILSNLLKQGTTIVMSTPYLDEAERATRVGLINQGRLMTADTPRAIKHLMKGTVIEIVADDIRRVRDIVRQVPDIELQMFGDRIHVVLPNAKSDSILFRNRIARAGIVLAGWRPIAPTLENVFISLLKEAEGRQP